MKKLMIAVAALVAGVAFADTAITSANTVGYAQKGIEANKFKQCGAQFEDVTTGTILADKVLGGLPGVNWDDQFVYVTTAPQIQVVGLDGNPTIYYYLIDGYVGPELPTQTGWCDEFGNITDLEFDPGNGFWVKNAAATQENLQGAGQVGNATSTDVAVPANVFSIQANAYPESVNLNDSTKVTFPDIVGVNWDDQFAYVATAPQIQIVGDDGNPTVYYYLNDGYVGPELPTKAGWCDEFGNFVNDVTVAAQAGFWAWAKTGAFTIHWVR